MGSAGETGILCAGRSSCAINRAVLPEAERFLTTQGVEILPDVVASIGGLIVNYLEWVQDASNFFWSEAEIEAAIDARVLAALDSVRAEDLLGRALITPPQGFGRALRQWAG